MLIHSFLNCLFLVTALLEHHVPISWFTVPPTRLECVINGLSYIHRRPTISTNNLRTCSSHQKETPIHFSRRPPFPSLCPWQSPMHLPSLWICLSWTCRINGVTRYVAFCVWLLSLSINFQGSSIL